MCYCSDFDLCFPYHPLEFRIIYNFHTEKQWYEFKKSLHFSSDSTSGNIHLPIGSPTMQGNKRDLWATKQLQMRV